MGPMHLRSALALLATALVLAALPAASARAAQDVLIVSDSLRDRFWTLSPVDGSIISDSFILNDAQSRFSQVYRATPSGRNTLLMNDIDKDVIYEYSMTGIYLRTLASATANGIVNPMGVCVHQGKIWFTCNDPSVTAQTAPGANAIWSMEMDGSNCAPWFANAALGAVRDILPVQGGFIVGDSLNDRINFVSFDRTVVRVWSSQGLTLPQQMSQRPEGGVVAAAFSAPYFGLYYFDGIGNLEGASQGVTSPRGVWVLDNGEYLYAGGTQINAFNPVTAQTRNIINQTSPTSGFRWISRVTVPTPCPADLNIDGVVDGADMGLLLGAWGPGNGIADINRDGVVDGADMGLLLGAWGTCPP